MLDSHSHYNFELPEALVTALGALLEEGSEAVNALSLLIDSLQELVELRNQMMGHEQEEREALAQQVRLTELRVFWRMHPFTPAAIVEEYNTDAINYWRQLNAEREPDSMPIHPGDLEGWQPRESGAELNGMVPNLDNVFSRISQDLQTLFRQTPLTRDQQLEIYGLAEKLPGINEGEGAVMPEEIRQKLLEYGDQRVAEGRFKMRITPMGLFYWPDRGHEMTDEEYAAFLEWEATKSQPDTAPEQTVEPGNSTGL